MTKIIKQYAIEVIDNDAGRNFSLNRYKFGGDVNFLGIQLYDAPDKAESNIEETVERGDLDHDEITVTEVHLHSDGKIFDGDGNDLVSHIANQTRQTEDKVVAGFRLCYAAEERRLRHASEANAEGPGR